MKYIHRLGVQQVLMCPAALVCCVVQQGIKLLPYSSMSLVLHCKMLQ